MPKGVSCFVNHEGIVMRAVRSLIVAAIAGMATCGGDVAIAGGSRDAMIQATRDLGAALTQGVLANVKSAAARVDFERQVLASSGDPLGDDAEMAVQRLLDSIAVLDSALRMVAPSGVCSVAYGFDGRVCEQAARKLLVAANPAAIVSVTSFSSQAEVDAAILAPALDLSRRNAVAAVVTLAK